MSGKASKTAVAAQKAVEKSQAKLKVERTPEQILSDLRRNLEAHLAITPGDIKVLMTAHDLLLEAAQNSAKLIQFLQEDNNRLTQQVEDFRKVYDQENRHMSFRVEETLEDKTVLTTDAVSTVAPGEAPLNEAVTATASAILAATEPE